MANDVNVTYTIKPNLDNFDESKWKRFFNDCKMFFDKNKEATGEDIYLHFGGSKEKLKDTYYRSYTILYEFNELENEICLDMCDAWYPHCEIWDGLYQLEDIYGEIIVNVFANDNDTYGHACDTSGNIKYQVIYSDEDGTDCDYYCSTKQDVLDIDEEYTIKNIYIVHDEVELFDEIEEVTLDEID